MNGWRKLARGNPLESADNPADDDVQGSYRLYKGLRVVAYGLNLSNEVFGFYQGSSAYPIQREFYHPTVSVGHAMDEQVRVRGSYLRNGSSLAPILAAAAPSTALAPHILREPATS